MAAGGILYLIFEKNLLAKSGLSGDSTGPAHNVLSRSLVGVQVRNALTHAKTTPNMKQIGFIVLAMIVTRSSVLSLQAKMGLPRGNQIVGWFILGLEFLCPSGSLFIYNSQSFHCSCHLHTACSPITTTYID